MPPKKAVKKAADKSTLFFLLTLIDRSCCGTSSWSESYKISRGLKDWNGCCCASFKCVSVTSADCVRRVKGDNFHDLGCKWISKLCVCTHEFKQLKMFEDSHLSISTTQYSPNRVLQPSLKVTQTVDTKPVEGKVIYVGSGTTAEQ